MADYMLWGDIEADHQTETGYNLKDCDRCWIIIGHPGTELRSEGSAFVTLTEDAEDGDNVWMVDDLADTTIVFSSFKAAAAHCEALPDECWPLCLGDYWRYGGVPRGKLRYAASRKALLEIGAL